MTFPFPAGRTNRPAGDEAGFPGLPEQMKKEAGVTLLPPGQPGHRVIAQLPAGIGPPGSPPSRFIFHFD